MFSRDRSNITRQVQRILSGDLNSDSVCAKFATTATDSKVYEVTCYNLEVVVLIGNRIKSRNGVLLKEFADKYIDACYSKQDNYIIIYNNGVISLPVTISPNEETVWVEKAPLTNLFGTTRQNVEYHMETSIIKAN